MALRNFILFIFLISFSAYSFEINFKKSFDCETQFRHYSYCISTGPKDWSTHEKNQILTAINEWPNLTKKILPKTINLYRVTFGHRPATTFTSKRAKDVFAWVEHPNKIFITDQFIQNKKIIEKSEYSLKSYILLHEFMHIFDKKNKNLSYTKEFLDLYNWEEILIETNQHRFMKTKWLMRDIDYSILTQRKEHLKKLFYTKEQNRAASLSIEYAADYGLPTMYATENPKECFAELFTNYFLAPELNQQIPRDTINWIEEVLEIH